MNVYRKSKKQADILKESIKNSAKKGNDSLFSKDVEAAYNFLEEMQKSVIFAYKAIECFCNETIPDDYVYNKTKSTGVVEQYGKQQIERLINTSEKISKILPLILNMESPSKEKFWSQFKNLERIRHEIIHSKSNTSKTILAELFSSKMDGYLYSSEELLNFFIKEEPDNPIFPQGFGVPEIRIHSIEDINEILSNA